MREMSQTDQVLIVAPSGRGTRIERRQMIKMAIHGVN